MTTRPFYHEWPDRPVSPREAVSTLPAAFVLAADSDVVLETRHESAPRSPDDRFDHYLVHTANRARHLSREGSRRNGWDVAGSALADHYTGASLDEFLSCLKWPDSDPPVEVASLAAEPSSMVESTGAVLRTAWGAIVDETEATEVAIRVRSERRGTLDREQVEAIPVPDDSVVGRTERVARQNAIATMLAGGDYVALSRRLPTSYGVTVVSVSTDHENEPVYEVTVADGTSEYEYMGSLREVSAFLAGFDESGPPNHENCRSTWVGPSDDRIAERTYATFVEYGGGSGGSQADAGPRGGLGDVRVDLDLDVPVDTEAFEAVRDLRRDAVRSAAERLAESIRDATTVGRD